MLKVDVLEYFGGNQSEVARTLGITRSSVNGWGERVPPLSAAKLHKVTRGKLKFDPSEYDDWYQKQRAS